MNERVFDYIVIGAGPAGLQLGYFMDRAGWDYLILEAADRPGNFFRTFPRHRKLISINKRYTGFDDPETRLRMDWNSLLSDHPELLFPNYSERYFPEADDLVRYLGDFAERFALRIRYSAKIRRIAKNGVFRFSDDAGRHYSCRRLIIATGVTRSYLPDIPGIELADTYSTASVDPADYRDQRVLVIGKGNSAFETADNLVETARAVHVAGPHSIKLAWQTHFVGHLRAVNNNILDTYQLKAQNAILDGNVLSIERKRDKYSVLFSFVRADEARRELEYDRVIACTGFRFDDSFFEDSCRPEMAINARFPAQTAGWESTNIPDLFFAGTLMQQRDYRKATSAFIHGFRYCVRSLFRMLSQRYHGEEWPHRVINCLPDQLMEAVVTRVNTTSALWQQFAFLGDVIVPRESSAAYYQEQPVDYIHQTVAGRAESYFIVTLEYGPDHALVDPFNVEVSRVAQDDAEQAFNAQYLHPVVRHFFRGRLQAEHHVAENLENEWFKPAHRDPLERFFAERLVSGSERIAGHYAEAQGGFVQ